MNKEDSEREERKAITLPCVITLRGLLVIVTVPELTKAASACVRRGAKCKWISIKVFDWEPSEGSKEERERN